ncbi:AAA family ATPase [Brooklawnia cerclae]|uniref:Nuclease SbcCD subunit C n=1 Tax=Brooklawnia cerclae TaxID=349934 RepID=A0ABX0SE56_9ACTN|nr:energy-coupling factor transporter ATP-binding protein EcfA2 [Brooklawnia cerclae]
MTRELVDWVDEQITASGLDDEVGLLILAAMEGDDQLDVFLNSGASSTRVRGSVPDAGVTAGGTFLRSIEVEGFRGIGATTTLRLKPKPGLTIVAGRNGSGKSSLAEALELVLTGDTYRWREKSKFWKDKWRNLHHSHARIAVDVLEEGSGAITVMSSWPDDATAVETRITRTQRIVDGKTQPQTDGIDGLGWARPLEQFRPMLSYDELGGLLADGPSTLYDALASILGVDELTAALKRIQTRLKQRKAPINDASTRRKELRAQAAHIADERAAKAADLLKRTSPDSAALRSLATGGDDDQTGLIAALKALASLSSPVTVEQVLTTAERLRTGVSAIADSVTDLSRVDLERLELLESALRLHAEHGDMSCPVCQRGTLDIAWADASRVAAGRARQQYAAYETAKKALDAAVAGLRNLVSAPIPGVLRSAPPVPELDEAVASARQAWTEFLDAPDGGSNTTRLAQADHIERTVGPLLVALEHLRERAAEEVGRRNDVWQPLASQIAAWCDACDAAAADVPVVDRLAKAEEWLKENDRALKNERLRPITEGARQAWSRLRQESNIELGDLRLEGSGTRRRVQIDASIDGADAGNFAVLSQGELHALALALFIPRATMAESPFRFVVLDDPVQAMDPAKVDGLVDLLGELARERQVIVLSHDDRLPAAVRRSSVDATVLEVCRGKNSNVTIRTLSDPAERYIADAFGIVKEWEDERLEELAIRRTLPGLLRFAVESAAKDAFYERTIKTGSALVDVERIWGDAHTTRSKVALAVVGETSDPRELDAWLGGRPYRRPALNVAGPAMHNGLRDAVRPRDAATDVKKLVADIRSAV